MGQLETLERARATLRAVLSSRSIPLFALGVIIVSIPQLILTPPFQVPDAFVHYLKAQALAEGHLFPSIIHHGAGSMMPSSVAAFVNLFATIPFHPTTHLSSIALDRASSLSWNAPPLFTTYTSASFDPPFLYLPTVFGLLLGSLLHLHLLQTYYLAEVIMLLVATALLTLAYSLMPSRGRPLVAALALLPMATSLYPSVSRDALIMPLTLLAIASRLHWAPAIVEGRIRSREYWYTALALLPIAMTKPPYWLLIPLLYIPFEELKARPALLYKPVLLPAASSLVLVGIWYGAVAHSLSVTFVSTAGISAIGQLQWLGAHPFEAIFVVYHTIMADKTFYYESAIGILGWLDTPLPHWVYPVFGFIICLTVAPLLASLTRSLDTWSPFLVATVFGTLLFLGVEVALYATWTPVGAPIVQGVQGRYLLPILPLLGLLARNSEGDGRLPALLGCLAVSAVAFEVVLSLVVVPATLITRFWV